MCKPATLRQLAAAQRSDCPIYEAAVAAAVPAGDVEVPPAARVGDFDFEAVYYSDDLPIPGILLGWPTAVDLPLFKEIAGKPGASLWGGRGNELTWDVLVKKLWEVLSRSVVEKGDPKLRDLAHPAAALLWLLTRSPYAEKLAKVLTPAGIYRTKAQELEKLLSGKRSFYRLQLQPMWSVAEPRELVAVEVLARTAHSAESAPYEDLKMFAAAGEAGMQLVRRLKMAEFREIRSWVDMWPQLAASVAYFSVNVYSSCLLDSASGAYLPRSTFVEDVRALFAECPAVLSKITLEMLEDDPRERRGENPLRNERFMAALEEAIRGGVFDGFHGLAIDDLRAEHYEEAESHLGHFKVVKIDQDIARKVFFKSLDPRAKLGERVMGFLTVDKGALVITGNEVEVTEFVRDVIRCVDFLAAALALGAKIVVEVSLQKCGATEFAVNVLNHVMRAKGGVFADFDFWTDCRFAVQGGETGAKTYTPAALAGAAAKYFL